MSFVDPCETDQKKTVSVARFRVSVRLGNPQQPFTTHAGLHADVRITEDAEKNSANIDLETVEVPRVLSLEPQSLLDVGNSFLAVASACGEQQRGVDLHKQFLSDLTAISDAVARPPDAVQSDSHCASDRTTSRPPKVFILEWLDPPFDAGHWVPEVLSVCACRSSWCCSAVCGDWRFLRWSLHLTCSEHRGPLHSCSPCFLIDLLYRVPLCGAGAVKCHTVLHSCTDGAGKTQLQSSHDGHISLCLCHRGLRPRGAGISCTACHLCTWAS